MSRKIRISTILLGFFFLAIVLLFIGPVLWMACLSLKTRDEIFSYPPKLFPAVLSAANYVSVLVSSRVVKYLMNSSVITIFSVLGNLVVTIPAVFAFSRFRFKFSNAIMFIILMFQMISPLVISIPLYKYFVKLGLLNSHIGLVVIYITTQIPFSVWLLKGFFDSIPKELDESAFIDGCRSYQVLWKIILPLVMPGIAAVLVFNVVNCWGQFIIPLIFINSSEKLPISVGIMQYVQTQTEGEITTHLLAAASIIALVPPMILVVLLQKFIVRVMVAGAVKE